MSQSDANRTPEERLILRQARQVVERKDLLALTEQLSQTSKIIQERYTQPLFQLTNGIAGYQKQIFQLRSLTEAASSTYSEALKGFRLDLPVLKLDYAQLFGPAVRYQLDLAGQLSSLTQSFSAFQSIYQLQRDEFKTVFEHIEHFLEKLTPPRAHLFLPNWRAHHGISEDKLKTLLLDEGLALAWVPDAELLDQLITARSVQERRTILGRKWKRVTSSCRSEVESIASTKYSHYRYFALKATEALENGHHETAQALAANLLDTMLRQTLKTAHTKVTGQNKRPDLGNWPLRSAIVFGGIWGSYTRFFEDQGDKIPHRFSRHASAHGVSKRQYSRINAVVAVMHTTAYLMLLDSGGVP
ncbi:hypothetical protein [Nocardia suismassiliense]|uniref:hypothetical protein n=1 Tax=Nocardia suismassiliense TaxID=2077092 RepID=UPI00131F45AC|nr:hypothetical protein [Nocardia suismassiliense]